MKWTIDQLSCQFTCPITNPTPTDQLLGDPITWGTSVSHSIYYSSRCVCLITDLTPRCFTIGSSLVSRYSHLSADSRDPS